MGKNKKHNMFCVIYDPNFIFTFIILFPIRQNLRKSEQTFQQCKYNDNILASIQFRIVYTVSKVGILGILFVSSGLHLNRSTITTTSIYPSVYLLVSLCHVQFMFGTKITITSFTNTKQ